MRHALALSLAFLFFLFPAVPAEGSDFIEAVKGGDTKFVKAALAKESSLIHATDTQGFMSLHWAGIRAHWDLFFSLLEHKPDVNAIGGDGGTPLHWACHHDNAEAIERPTPIKLDEIGYNDYVGAYDLGQSYECKVWIEGDRLLFMEFAAD